MTFKDADATNIVEATEAAVAAASHLTVADAGAVEALRAMARKIAAWDQIVEWALEDAARDDHRPMVPANDNVTLSAYVKTCVELGLTPSGRTKLAGGKPKPATRKSALASVSDIPRPA